MPLTIHLTEGPNVHGLPDDRTPLYVGHYVLGNNLVFLVLEGKKVGTPRSYKLHVGNLSSELEDDEIAPLVETEITLFTHTSPETIIDFTHQGTLGRLVLSNTSPRAHYSHGSIDTAVETTYNLFGPREASLSLLPQGIDHYV